MSLVNEALALGRRLILEYESTDGLSLDSYWNKPKFQPMAEGKYLQSLATLHATGLLSDAQLNRKARAAVTRLSKQVVRNPKGSTLWGLGFPWRGCKANEPFLITTSVVVRGLLAVARCGIESEPFRQMCRSSLDGLEAWWDGDYPPWRNGSRLPWFSPSIHEEVLNPYPHAAATLSLAGNLRRPGHVSCCDFPEVVEIVEETYAESLGWPYSMRRGIIDLVHQAYILDAILLLKGESYVLKFCLEITSRLFAGYWHDAMVKLDLSDPANWTAANLDGILIPVKAESYFLLRTAPARLWALGEMLGVLSRLMLAADPSNVYWQRVSEATVNEIISRINSNGPERSFARHTMHALYGLASFVSASRSKASVVTRKGP